MNLRENRGRRREHPELEITPLIDVVFLLLIFFLVTTSFAQSRDSGPDTSEIPIQLPGSSTGQSTGDDQRAVLFVRPDGTVELRGDLDLKGGDLAEKLTDLHRRRPEVPIMIKGDEEASHGRMVDVLDALRSAGFKDVNMATRKSAAEKGAD